MRLIDADALMQTLGITDMDCDKCAWYKKEWSCCERGGDFEDACCAIDDAPTIEERKTGRWILQDDKTKPLYGWHLCSECGSWIGEPANFCSVCGADMRGEKDENTKMANQAEMQRP